MWSTTIDGKHEGTTPQDSALALDLAQTTDAARLVEAALRSRSRDVLTAVGKNPALPEWARELVRERWRGARQQSVLREAAKHPDVPAHLLEWFAFECGLARWVVQNPACPTRVFERVAAEDPHLPTLQALVQSPHTPAHVLELLGNHDALTVRELVAARNR